MKTRRGFIKSCTLALLAATLTTSAMAKSCLWKVTSQTGTLYLQGSIHLLKAEHYPLAPAIEEAYAKSEVLVLEVDMAEMAAPKTQQRIMAKARLPGNGTLRKELDAETYQKLDAACTETGLPIAALEKFKPWFAAMTLTLVKMQKLGFDPNHGLDQYFYDKAKTDGKKVIGLESVDVQLDLFDSLSATNPNDFIKHALADLEILETELSILDKAWESGDIDTVGRLITQSFEGYPKFHRTFLTDRNKRWIKTLDRLLKKPKTHMMVVGAGHLPGKGGLLELLEKKGYTLEQL